MELYGGTLFLQRHDLENYKAFLLKSKNQKYFVIFNKEQNFQIIPSSDDSIKSALKKTDDNKWRIPVYTHPHLTPLIKANELLRIELKDKNIDQKHKYKITAQKAQNIFMLIFAGITVGLLIKTFLTHSINQVEVSLPDSTTNLTKSFECVCPKVKCESYFEWLKNIVKNKINELLFKSSN
ncbi:MAG: hypothetical protein K1060chlam5_00241 [Candidatus Anoxychlamydiales bacterium]|nr:hypothetical protein [Candidatus Anoxychlamydiales bacterium]